MSLSSSRLRLRIAACFITPFASFSLPVLADDAPISRTNSRLPTSPPSPASSPTTPSSTTPPNPANFSPGQSPIDFLRNGLNVPANASAPAVLPIVRVGSGSPGNEQLLVPAARSSPDRILSLPPGTEIGIILRAPRPGDSAADTTSRLQTTGAANIAAGAKVVPITDKSNAAVNDAAARFSAADHWMKMDIGSGDIAYIRGNDWPAIQAAAGALAGETAPADNKSPMMKGLWGQPDYFIDALGVPHRINDNPAMPITGARRGYGPDPFLVSPRTLAPQSEPASSSATSADRVAECAALTPAQRTRQLGLDLLARRDQEFDGSLKIAEAYLAEPALLDQPVMISGLPCTPDSLRAVSTEAAAKASKSADTAHYLAAAILAHHQNKHDLARALIAKARKVMTTDDAAYKAAFADLSLRITN